MANMARSSARRNGAKSLRLEARKSGLSSSARAMAFCARSSRPASALLAANTDMARRKVGLSRIAFSAHDDAMSYGLARKWACAMAPCNEVHGRIERAQAHGMRNVLKCQVWLTSPNSQPTTKPPGLRCVGIDRQSPIHESRSFIELMRDKSECITTHTQRDWVIAAEMHCFPGQPGSFGTLPDMLDHPATRLANHITPRGHAISGGQTRVEFDRLAKKLERLAVCVHRHPTNFRQPTQVIVVRIQILGWLAPSPLDLFPLQLWSDCSDDTGSYVVL